mmetsp:Transcript_15944/g.20865  ORF Transcript_15944/g.20865 Transcript_15944/m.20865 type:complete len:163 (+) Transcript_15944:342-830(+)
MTTIIEQTIIDKELLKEVLSIAETNPLIAASTIHKEVDRIKTSHFTLNNDHRRIVNLLNMAYNNLTMNMINDAKKRIEQALSIIDGIRNTRIHDQKLLHILNDARLYAAMGKDKYAKDKLMIFLKYTIGEGVTFESSEALEMSGTILISEANYKEAGKVFYE